LNKVNLRAGDWVQVLNPGEILTTLDEHGSLDGLPFMPQMLRYCGKRFRVSKSAHKLCDTVNGTGGRRLKDAVFLEDLRCDGQAYGGCEMECLLFWKTQWLRRVDGDAASPEPGHADPEVRALEELLNRNVSPADRQNGNGRVYACQATEMPRATTWMSVWDVRQYVDDWRSGNATIGQIVSVLFFLGYDTVASAGLGIGGLLRWSYDRVQQLRGASPYPSRPGALARHARTPSLTLNLRPGEMVRVKTHAEVLATVTEDLVNRGMGFHPEMVPYCSRTLQVSKRLRRIMNEKTGQIRELKNECVVLEGATCEGRFTKPLLCPRAMSPYWREIWLSRVEPSACSPSESPTSVELSVPCR
jgi:hypothetical protein